MSFRHSVVAAAVLGLAVPAFAQAVKVDPKIPAYKKVAGVSGSINSVGSDTLNNVMTMWAEEFVKLYPNDAKLTAFLGPGPWPEDDASAAR